MTMKAREFLEAKIEALLKPVEPDEFDKEAFSAWKARDPERLRNLVYKNAGRLLGHTGRYSAEDMLLAVRKGSRQYSGRYYITAYAAKGSHAPYGFTISSPNKKHPGGVILWVFDRGEEVPITEARIDHLMKPDDNHPEGWVLARVKKMDKYPPAPGLYDMIEFDAHAQQLVGNKAILLRPHDSEKVPPGWYVTADNNDYGHLFFYKDWLDIIKRY